MGFFNGRVFFLQINTRFMYMAMSIQDLLPLKQYNV
jgi:hypothetical protein